MTLIEKEWRIHRFNGEYRLTLVAFPSFHGDREEQERLFLPFEVALGWSPSKLTKVLLYIYEHLTQGSRVHLLPQRRRYSRDVLIQVRRRLSAAVARGELTIELLKPNPVNAFSAPPVFHDPWEPSSPVPKLELPTTLFEIQVMDQFGRALESLPVIFSVGGSQQTVDTDAEGIARLAGKQTSFASVRIEDVQAIKDTLDALGGSSPEGKAPPESADVTVHMVSLSSFPSISLEDRTKHILVICEPVVRVRLIGMFFDEAKSFLLPSAMSGIQKIVEVYQENPTSKLLIVGHTDREGKIQDNAELSLERAKSIAAYVQDDVDHWLSFYDESLSMKKRWGALEDRYMLSILPFGSPHPYLRPGQSFKKAVREFQAEHGLQTDGIAGPETRRALISDYMAMDRTTVPEGTEIVTHGCGEHFPAVTTEDGKEEAGNRRVEIFVFPRKIDPEPSVELSEAGSTEYSRWLDQVQKTIDVSPIQRLDELGIRLVDTQGNSVPEARFQLETPNGQILEERLDEDGFCKLINLAIGICKVRFLDFDALDWGGESFVARPLPSSPTPFDEDDVELVPAPIDPFLEIEFNYEDED